MNIIFAGTPAFAAQALSRIVEAGFNVPLVLTQPDRPSGRGLKLTPSAVKQVAQQHGIALAQPVSLRCNHAKPEYAAQAQLAMAQLRDTPCDVMVVAAYGLILPLEVLQLPRHGCVNIHASLLPRWRGAAPIHRAIEAGDLETGISLMQMDEGLDTGDVLFMQRIPINECHTTARLHDELAELGAHMVVEYLHQLQNGHAPVATPQPNDGVTYADKILKTQAQMDWQMPAADLARKLRAFDPAPGCVTMHQGEPLKLWAGEATNGTHELPVGTVLAIDADGVHIACGAHSVLCVRQMQKAGGKRAPAAQVAHSAQVAVGACWA